jgi:hypothetical protein
MSVQDFMAEQIERMGAALADFIDTTEPSRLAWRPELPGSAPTRSILEQAGECIAVNRRFAALLRGDEDAVQPGGTVGVSPANAEDARSELIASAGELAAAVRALDAAGLERTYNHWRGPTSGKFLIVGAYRNMAYHAGQVNLIQMLAGDAVFHVPPTWF